MAHKVLLTLSSHPKHQKKLFHHIGEFVNKLSPLGLELTDAWYTVYGDAPEILLGFVPRNHKDEQLQTILRGEQWTKILDEFKQYVTDYEQKIVKASSGFQF